MTCFILLFVICGLFFSGCSSNNSKPKNEGPAAGMLLDAQKLFSAGKFEQAVEVCSKVHKLDPKKTEALYCLGNSYARLRNPGEAIKYFEKFLQLSPDSPEAHYNIGTSYALMKNYDKALKSFEQVIALDDEMFQAYFALGLTYYKMGRKDKAEQEYERLKELNEGLADQLNKIIS